MSSMSFKKVSGSNGTIPDLQKMYKLSSASSSRYFNQIVDITEGSRRYMRFKDNKIVQKQEYQV